MSLAELTSALNSIGNMENINFVPHDPRSIKIFYGIPPIPFVGVEFVEAKFDAPRTKMVKCLTGGGVHVDNKNSAGEVSIGILEGSLTGGAIEVMNFTGVPFPVFIYDAGSAASTVVALDCRLVDTPIWKRAAAPGIDVYTFSCKSMFMMHGIRLFS